MSNILIVIWLESYILVQLKNSVAKKPFPIKKGKQPDKQVSSADQKKKPFPKKGKKSY
jgi:hypothetical protein